MMKLNMTTSTCMTSITSMHMTSRSYRASRIGICIDIPESSTRMRTFPIRIISIRMEFESPSSEAAILVKDKARKRALSFTERSTENYFPPSRNAFIFTGESVITTSTPSCCALR